MTDYVDSHILKCFDSMPKGILQKKINTYSSISLEARYASDGLIEMEKASSEDRQLHKNIINFSNWDKENIENIVKTASDGNNIYVGHIYNRILITRLLNDFVLNSEHH
jgi:hypothetical protein